MWLEHSFVILFFEICYLPYSLIHGLILQMFHMCLRRICTVSLLGAKLTYVHYYKLVNFVVQIYIFADTFFWGGVILHLLFRPRLLPKRMRSHFFPYSIFQPFSFFLSFPNHFPFQKDNVRIIKECWFLNISLKLPSTK